MSFASEIKKIRVDCMLSQQAFAKELGVTQLTITRWETGKNIPSYSAMQRLLAYCEIKKLNSNGLKDSWKEQNE